jgi:hypothetical protein
METSAINGSSRAEEASMLERTREIAEQERLRKQQEEQQAKAEAASRAPEQAAGRVVNDMV